MRRVMLSKFSTTFQDETIRKMENTAEKAGNS